MKINWSRLELLQNSTEFGMSFEAENSSDVDTIIKILGIACDAMRQHEMDIQATADALPQ
jgi:hypothetical protein